MFYFKNDYSEGCHPNILRALSETNITQEEGYGDDRYSKKAKELIRKEANAQQAAVYFVSGGTQANLIIISSLLKPHEAVISAHTGHVNVHEAGAIESTGHKVCTAFSEDGKLTIKLIEEVVRQHAEPPHMVKPKLVYISNATEIGSVYSANELKTLYEYCQAQELYLFVDGARLGAAIMANENTLSLADMSKYSDIFYIGETKNGALLGEAIVIPNKKLQIDFDYHLKQKGALMAKGRVLGIQFSELFTDKLFFKLAKHANSMAMRLAKEIENEGYRLLFPPETNQIFPIFPNELAQNIQEQYGCYPWEKVNEKELCLRMVCSWATTEDAINDFLNFIKK